MQLHHQKDDLLGNAFDFETSSPNVSEKSNTYRDSKQIDFAWREQSNVSTIEQIQDICSILKAKLGYNLIQDEKQLLDPEFKILGKSQEVEFLQDIPLSPLHNLQDLWTSFKESFFFIKNKQN